MPVPLLGLLMSNLSPAVLATCMQFVQYSGETVFVPAGWHHTVLNLEDTVCVTQNFASPGNYTQVAQLLYNSSEESYLVDAWRENTLDVWPQLRGMAESLCVHCCLPSRGNKSELLLDRPVCIACEKKRPNDYEEISGRQAEEKYGINLSAMDEDDAPPYVVRKDPISRKKLRYYLHANVKDCLDDDDSN